MAALTSSPAPQSDPPTRLTDDLEARLDDQILKIRTKIAKLRSQKQKLSKSLLGNYKIQKLAQDRGIRPASSRNTTTNEEQDTFENESHPKLHQRLEEALADHKHENDVRQHNITHGVTAFPWTDTANERRGADGREPLMLGIRIDLHPTTAEVLQDGKEKPDKREEEKLNNTSSDQEPPSSYIILLRKLQHDQRTYLKVHWTNIPKHIDTEQYERRYLPLPDVLADGEEEDETEESFQDDSGIDVTQDLGDVNNDTLPHAVGRNNVNVEGGGQDLHKFMRALRDELQSWWYRRQGILRLRYELGLPGSSLQSFDSLEGQQTKYGITNLESTTHDARHLKITWQNGKLALLRVDSDGFVERAVVYGPDETTGVIEEDENELNELSMADDANTNRARSGRKRQTGRKSEPRRMPQMERKLNRMEDGSHVSILTLLGRLPIVDATRM